MDKTSKNKTSKNERIMEYVENNSQLVGTVHRELVDKNTGEIIDVEQTLKFNYGSKHFWKCYLTDFLKVIDALEGRHLKIFTYIIRKTKSNNNLFICTYDKMVEDLKCSRQTIAETMKILQKTNFIRKKQNGIWIINPNVLMKGNDNKRHSLYSEFLDSQPVEKTKKKKNDRNDSHGKDQHKEVSEENSGATYEEDYWDKNDWYGYGWQLPGTDGLNQSVDWHETATLDGVQKKC